MQCSARIGGHWPGNTLHTMSSMRWRLASAATECDALTANTQCVLNAWLRLLRRKLPRPQTRIGMLLGVSRRSCFRLLTQRVIIFDALGHHRRVCEVVSAIRASWWEPSLGFPAGCYGLIELLIGSKSCSIANLSCSLWRACSAACFSLIQAPTRLLPSDPLMRRSPFASAYPIVHSEKISSVRLNAISGTSRSEPRPAPAGSC
jgi:hypothetical protein